MSMGGIQSFRPTNFQALWRAIKTVKTWQLILIFIPLCFIAATLLRLDHLTMLDLKNAVLAADQSEDDAKISETLTKLRNFTTTHTIVNILEKNGTTTLTFGSGPIYLERQYVRTATAKLAEAEKKAAQHSNESPHGNIFAKAMAVCRPLAIRHGWTWDNPNYLNCFTGELNKYPATDHLTTTLTADLPSTQLYRHDFASPLWTPTLSGLALLLCFLLVLIICFRLLVWLFLRFALLFIK